VHDDRFVEPLEKLADLQFAEGQGDSAIRRVSAHLERIPDHSGLQSYYGSLLARIGLIDQAEGAYLKAISLDDHNLTAYLGVGRLYQEHGRSEQAIEKYQEALKRDSRLNSVRLLLAAIHEEKGDYKRAESLYREILDRDPRFAPAANNLAFLITKQGGNIDVALSYAQTARERLPGDPYVADTIGWIYYQKNAFKRASNVLKEASEKLSSNPTVQYHLGMALLKSGDIVGARRTLRAALAIDKSFSEAEQAKVALASI
jgi:tetratricopeptide (TPR) repeat protein